MAKGKQVYARIYSEKTITQLAKECDRRDISRPDLVREAIELHLGSVWDGSRDEYLIDARDKAERSLKASREINEKLEAENVKIEAAFETLFEDCGNLGKKKAIVVEARDKLQRFLTIAEQEIERLKKHNTDLDDMRKTLISQRDKFKQKFEEVVRINEILLSDVRRMQSLGVFARAFELKRFNTAKYVIQTGKDNETSA